MRFTRFLFSSLTGTALATAMILSGCGDAAPKKGDFAAAPAVDKKASEPDADGFVWKTEQFADLKLIRYQIPGWEKLSPKQQALVYCLNMAGLSGRDIMYDQNNRYNLRIRRLLENIETRCCHMIRIVVGTVELKPRPKVVSDYEPAFEYDSPQRRLNGYVVATRRQLGRHIDE